MDRIIVKQEEFNTNNAWGFGGAIGTLTTYADGFSKRAGAHYFRHLKAERFAYYYNTSGEQISKTEFENPWEKK